MLFHSEEETFNWAVEFGRGLKPGDKVALYGNLGAGKTVISRGVCKGLGFTGSVCSPTYTILHEYPNASSNGPNASKTTIPASRTRLK